MSSHKETANNIIMVFEVEMRGIIAYNPAAGRIPSRILVERAARILKNNGWSIDMVRVRSGKHITKLARDAAAAKVDALFVAGG
ncbi:MAG: hypothetical protein KAT29_06025, partial [Anaerolineales bacterium]|nr:hypothetical protein [Anaerolineales bacterium]